MWVYNKYDDGEYEVIEYTRDGETISHTVRQLKSQVVNGGGGGAPPIIPEPTIAEIQENQLIIMDALATIYELVLPV